MKIILRWTGIAATALLIVGCATAPRDSSRVQAPASQETVNGEARIRAKAHTDLGFEYYAQRQLGVALEEAKVALKDDKTYTPTYNLLALVYMSLGDQKAAEDSFLKALQISPGDPEISNNYGWYLCQNKREAQSFQYFGQALQNPLYPTPIVALANAGECALQIKDYKGAEGYLGRALAQQPDFQRALLAMAAAKYAQKQYAEARFYIAEAHKNSEPTAASAWLAFRIARQANNRDDQARYLSLLRKKFPDSDEYRKLTQGVLE